MSPVLKFLLKLGRVIGLFLLASHMTITFLFSGLFLNLLQYILYKTVYKVSRKWYRKLNYYLIYYSWTQILAVYEWRSNSSVNMYGDDIALSNFGKEHSIIVMNHKYDIDWVVCWFITNYLRVLALSKTFAKKQLRKVPVIGWGWIFAEMIFLERNWDKDKLTLGGKLDKLVEYEDPIMILLFCEGTRFTPEKHKASIEFAKARNLPQLKHHLVPRTSGFNFTARHLQGKIPAIYNIQLGFPETEQKPTFSNLLRGYSYTADLYLERIPLDDVPTQTDETSSKWLHELYQRKDQLMGDYMRTGKFPGKCVHLSRSYRSLLNSVFWAVFVGVPWWYLVYSVLSSGNLFVTTVATSIFVALCGVMYFMVGATKASKGSSYGKEQKSPAKTKNGVHSIERTNGEGSGDDVVAPPTDKSATREQSNNNL